MYVSLLDTDLRPVYEECDVLQTGETNSWPVYKQLDIL